MCCAKHQYQSNRKPTTQFAGSSRQEMLPVVFFWLICYILTSDYLITKRLKVLEFVIIVNNQLDILFSMYLFISLLHMFRATQCSSSGESNFINTSSGIYHSV